MGGVSSLCVVESSVADSGQDNNYIYCRVTVKERAVESLHWEYCTCSCAEPGCYPATDANPEQLAVRLYGTPLLDSLASGNQNIFKVGHSQGMHMHALCTCGGLLTTGPVFMCADPIINGIVTSAGCSDIGEGDLKWGQCGDSAEVVFQVSGLPTTSDFMHWTVTGPDDSTPSVSINSMMPSVVCFVLKNILHICLVALLHCMLLCA